MLHHISIPAFNPSHVASVLAELIGGRTFPFPGPLPGAFVAVAGDAHGSMIEVYPNVTTLQSGRDDAGARFVPVPASDPSAPVAFHALLSVPVDRDQIERIGAREGWRTKHVARGAPDVPPAFHVIEVWVENRIMIELVTEAMVGPYVASMQALEGRGALALQS